MKDNLVVGGGISGLIFCYYNPEFFMITDSLGGLLKQESKFGVITLWDTPETRELLRDLEFDIKPYKAEIRYFFNGKIYDVAPEVLRKEYIEKKMGPLSKRIDFTDLALSTQETNYIPALKIDFEELTARLLAEIERRQNYTLAKVVEIRDDEIMVEEHAARKSNGWKYKTLVSTIPAYVFWKLWKGTGCREVCKPEEFEFSSTTTVSMRTPHKSLIGIFDRMDGQIPAYIYYLDNSRFHRFSLSSKGYFALQFPNVVKKKETAEYLEVDESDLDYRVEKIGQFITHRANIPPRNVMFLGRHAQWDYKVKVQDIVRVSRFSKFMLADIRSRQSRFNKNFMDFNSLTLKDRQELTEKWILYEMAELTELLDETNWKLHRPDKHIDRDKILNEWIDAFKFLLGIADIWSFTNAELFKMFHEKSSFVERRFEEEEVKNGK